MNGPHQLTALSISLGVPNNRVGYYTLHDSALTVRYVGRSDTDLRRRLLEHLEDDYTYFSFSFAATPQEAFHGECAEYHRNYYNPLDNEMHPDKPDALLYCPCPVCGAQ